MRPLNVLRSLEILGRIGDKTSVLVVMPPKDGSRRFSEIRQAIPGV
jgi:DNA-binding HxlR family transcriptional regulator